MKQLNNNTCQRDQVTDNNAHLATSCGNCWGHQQYEQGFRSIEEDPFRGKRDNFISRFVKKYIRK